MVSSTLERCSLHGKGQMAVSVYGVVWVSGLLMSTLWIEWWGYGMGRRMLWTMNTCILLIAFWMHRDTVTRSWGPLLCHSSTTITSCCSMIIKIQLIWAFICHIHNYTEFNQQWNVFSAFNPSKCTHTWSSGQPTLRHPGSSWGFGALLRGLTSVVDNSCRSWDSNPQPRITSPMLYPLGHDCPNARPHVARIWTQFLEAENIPVLAWPAYSPDMSPIEHVWDTLDQRIWQCVSVPANIQQLRSAIEEERTFHRPHLTTRSTLCEGDVLHCVRQMVVTPDTDWFSEPQPPPQIQ